MKTVAAAVNAAFAQERTAWAACKHAGSDADAAHCHAAWLAAVDAANSLVREHPVELADSRDQPVQDHPT